MYAGFTFRGSLVWAKQNRYCKLSKPKLFYLTYRKKKMQCQKKKKEKSLHVFPCLCFFHYLGVLWLWSGCSKEFYGFLFTFLFLINFRKKDLYPTQSCTTSHPNYSSERICALTALFLFLTSHIQQYSSLEGCINRKTTKYRSQRRNRTQQCA